MTEQRANKKAHSKVQLTNTHVQQADKLSTNTAPSLQQYERAPSQRFTKSKP